MGRRLDTTAPPAPPVPWRVRTGLLVLALLAAWVGWFARRQRTPAASRRATMTRREAGSVSTASAPGPPPSRDRAPTDQAPPPGGPSAALAVAPRTEAAPVLIGARVMRDAPAPVQAPDRPAAVWLSLPSAESLGFRGAQGLALPGGSTLALPEAKPLPRPVRAPGPRGDAWYAGRSWASTRVRAWAAGVEISWVLTLMAISGLALALRLVNHASNYDVFIDEITYSQLGQAVALGHGASLYGTPFFLHPPLFFYLEGGLLDLFGGAHASPINLVLELRPINCVIGAIECGLTMLFIRRLTNRPAAIVLGMFMACDPFLLLWDGRVLLETLAMTTAIAAWLCLEWIARRDMATPQRELAERVDAHPWTRVELAMVVLAGGLFGVSLLSKETYGFVGVVPLAAMFVLGSPVRRTVSGAIFAIAVVPYAVYLFTVVLAGHLAGWWNQNVAGLLRAVGTKQITGFNQPGHHSSASSRVGAELALYLVSYLIITAVGVAALTGVIRWLVAARAGRRLTTQRRLGIMLGAGGIGYVGYAVLFGAFEVQIFYMGLIAGLPVLATEVMATRPRLARRLNRRGILVFGAVLASLALAFELAADVRLRTERDTTLPRLANYVSHHLRYPTLVDSTDGVTQFILQGVRIDGPTTIHGLETQRPDYVILDAGLISQGYNTLGPGFLQWLGRHAHVVWQATGRTAGRVLLFRTIYASAGTEAGG